MAEASVAKPALPVSTSRSERLTRAGLLAVGLVGMLVGLVIGVREVPTGSWFHVARWLVGGVVVHDAVIAPAAVVLAVVVLRRAPAALRPALRTGLLAVGALGLVLGTVLVASTMRRNPTVLPGSTTEAVVGVAVLVVAVAVVTAVVLTLRRRRR